MMFGLLGKSLSHSFSRDYFTEKFHRQKLDHQYENFEISRIEDWLTLPQQYPSLKGLNVTIPYKTSVIPYLHEVSPEAREIGAVNTIKIEKGLYTGYNTDVYGFEGSLSPLLKPHHRRALILGSGGAAKAVGFVLEKKNILYKIVSRSPGKGQLSYETAGSVLSEYMLVINSTPIGTFPKINESPPLSLDLVGENHLFYDLIYNPSETQWLKDAKKRGAAIKNGMDMLRLQAERSWEIWNQDFPVR